MTDITEFLLARIAEDENRALAAGHGCGYLHGHNAGWVEVEFPVTHNARPVYDKRFIERFSPTRVLAECEAKRLIVEQFVTAWARPLYENHMPEGHEWLLGDRNGRWEAVKALAQVYGDHPDFDPSWA